MCVKGFVGGLLLWRQNGYKFDAQSREDGMLIPNMRSEPVLENCGAEFILVVEKHSVFVDLMQKKFYNDYPCIIVTEVGTAGMRDRRFLKLLDTLGLPMYGLFDGDVGGIRIFSNYAFGTHEKAFDSVNLTCPHMTWLGVWPTDISKPSEKLSVHENELLDDLLKEEFVTEEDNPRLFEELKNMKRTQRKANQVWAQLDKLFAISDETYFDRGVHGLTGYVVVEFILYFLIVFLFLIWNL